MSPTSLFTDVLIVGAGPTGLMAANQLSRFDIDFIVIDSKPGPTPESRAIAVTPRSLEIYQQLGLSERVLKQGAQINSFSIYHRGKLKSKININLVGDGKSEFPYMFAFEQSKNEELLFQNLKDLGADVFWETEFVQLAESNESIIAEAKHKEQQFTIQAKYMIACDGASSLVRHQLNIPFNGGTYENRFFVADTTLKWNEGYDRLIIAPGEKNFCGFFPLQGDGAYRVLGTLPDAYRDKEDISFHEIEKVVKETIGVDLTFENVNWFSTYKLHHRCVDHFTKGRVHLAGDCAHIHSPAGGQGMNTGLQDAYNIAWKLAFVLKKWAKPEILDTYNEERIPFARWLIKATDRAFNIMTGDNWFKVRFRRYIVLNLSGVVVKIKWLWPTIFKNFSQIGYSYAGKSLAIHQSKQPLTFKAGDRLPYVKEDGLNNSIYELFKSPAFSLLHITASPLITSAREEIVSAFPFPVQWVEQPLNDSWKKLGVKKEIFILVRPDNYIGWVHDQLSRDNITRSLSAYF